MRIGIAFATRSICAVLLLVATSLTPAAAQEASNTRARAFAAPLDERVPFDPAVTAGELDNGLRYFIRENDEPANRAALRLVVDAGSILEDDDQLGVAHYLEHMAFNGTENFEKQELVSFMESVGMRLGPGVNAGTSYDETVYMLTIPTDEPGNLETAFQILEDWAHGVTLDPREIDLERGVVIEEWRANQNARSRAQQQHNAVVYGGSRYAERLPIGTLESLETLGREALARFYRDWYRPDLMAVVAVGDFEAQRIEALLRGHFGTMRARDDDAPERVEHGVPTHDETLYSIATDSQLTETSVTLIHKRERRVDPTVGGARDDIVERLYQSLLSRRLREIAREADPPFQLRGSFNGPLTRDDDAYVLTIVVPEDGIERGLGRLASELERAARHGFTASELEREKLELMRRVEREHADRDNRSSPRFAGEYQRAFVFGAPAPSIEYRYALHERFMPDITLDEVNGVGRRWIRAADRVVTLTAPRKDGLDVPGEDTLAAVLNDAAEAELEPYVDAADDAQLLASPPEPGDIVAERTKDGGLTEWQLGNGIRVVLKPTDFDADEVVFRGFSPGGTSLASDDNVVPARTVGVISNGGVGELGPTDLEKVLAGESVNVYAFVSELEEGIAGRGSRQDLETLFRLVYMRVTAPRADETAFQSSVEQQRRRLINRDRNPVIEFSDRFTRIMTRDHPRRQPFTLDMLEEMDLEASFDFYQRRFADAGDYTFVFVGAFDVETMRPLVERYLASLPDTGREETWRDVGVRPPEGVIEETVYAGIEPRSLTGIAFTGPFDSADQSERALLRATAEVLQTRLRGVLREELGGTYSVRVNPGITRRPVETYALTIDFGADPERNAELVDVVFDEIEALKREGPTEAQVADVRAAMRRAYEEDLEQNGYWLSSLVMSYQHDADPGAELIRTYGDAIQSVRGDAVQDAAVRYFDTENYVRVTLMPAAYAP